MALLLEAGLSAGSDSLVGVLGPQLLCRGRAAACATLLTNNFVRGAVSGLGLVNLFAALAELADIFAAARRARAVPRTKALSLPQSVIGAGWSTALARPLASLGAPPPRSQVRGAAARRHRPRADP